MKFVLVHDKMESVQYKREPKHMMSLTQQRVFFVLVLIGWIIAMGGIFVKKILDFSTEDAYHVPTFHYNTLIETPLNETGPDVSDVMQAHTILFELQRSMTLIQVEIRGAVHNPGMYCVSSSKTLHDLILLSGGLHPDVDISRLPDNTYLRHQSVIQIPFKALLECQ